MCDILILNNDLHKGKHAMSKDENLFWDLLDEESSTLYVDNDMCYIEDGETEETHSFDFSPERLVFLFADKMGITAESV